MDKINKCISCEVEETRAPLVSIRYAQNPTWICTQCLPTLIHNPDKLQSKFANMNVENPPEPKID
jgi:hypothetical protein